MSDFPYICPVFTRIKHRIHRRKVIKALGSFDQQALWEASLQGHIPYIEYLIDGGIGVNGQNERGKTALMLAAGKGEEEVISLLLSRGASVDLVDHEQMTALMIASKEGHLDCVKILLESGAEVNRRDEFGYTALILAVREGNTSIVRKLLEVGADPNVTDKKGQNVLSFATFSPSLANLLKKYGAEEEKSVLEEEVENVPYLGKNIQKILRKVGDELSEQEHIALFYDMLKNLGLLLQFKRNPEELDRLELNEQVENIHISIDILIKLRNIMMDFISIIVTFYEKSQSGEQHPQDFLLSLRKALDTIDICIQEIELKAEDTLALEVIVPHEAKAFKEVVLKDWLAETGEQIEMGQYIAALETEGGELQIKAHQGGFLAHRARSGSRLKVGDIIGTISPETTSQ